MGLNIHKKILLWEESIQICLNCKLAYDGDSFFCSKCGNKLIKKSSKVYANIGKSGITSISYKTPDGITINSKGRTTIALSKGLSYTTFNR